MTTETTNATPVVATTEKKARKARSDKGTTKTAKTSKAKAKVAKGTKTGKKAKSANAGKVVKVKRDADFRRIKRIGDKEHKVDLTRYHTVISASGNSSLDNGDDVASTLRGKSLDEVYAIAAKATGMPQTQLRSNYGHLNPGMQRMNLGNKVRGALRDAADE